MAVSDVIKGSDFILYINIGGVNMAVCQSKDCKLSMSADLLPTTTKDGGRGKRYEYGGKNDYTLTPNGLTNLIDGANFSHFQLALMNAVKLPFLFTSADNVQYTGTVLVPTIEIDSPDNAISSFNTTLQGDGSLVAVYAGDIPPTPSDIVTIIDQFGNTIASINAPGSYNVLRFDTIDCGEAVQPEPDLIITS